MLSVPRSPTQEAAREVGAPNGDRSWIGPYELVEKLGQGGMATIYRAHHRGAGSFKRDVVVKAMLSNLSSIPSLVEMFEAEARLTSQLRHANIVQVENYGVDHDGTPYLVMELLDGKNLSQLRSILTKAKRRMPIGVAVRVAYDLCAALGCAHNFVSSDGERMQIIHRDVSPSNVMVQRDGSVKLLDFGVAKLSSAAGQAVTSSLKGKFAYMAPEQVRQRPIDRRCDVFAAGIVLHEMLTGRRLFGSKSEMETLRRVAAAEVIAPSKSRPGVSAALDAVVMRALSLRPADRYESGDAMAEALATLGPLAGRRELATFVESTAPLDATVRDRMPEIRSVPIDVGIVDTQAEALPEPTKTRRGHLRLISSERLDGNDLEVEIVADEIVIDERLIGFELDEVTDPSLPQSFDQSVSVLPIFPRPTAESPQRPATPIETSLPAYNTLEVDPVPNLRRRSNPGAKAVLVAALGVVTISVALFVATRGTQPLIDAPPPVIAQTPAIVLPPRSEAPKPADTVGSLVGLDRDLHIVGAPKVIAPKSDAKLDATMPAKVVAKPDAKLDAKIAPRVEAKSKAKSSAGHRSVKEGAIVDPFAGGE